MSPRIPVHVVVGALGAGEFIERMCAEKADWAGLVLRPPAVPRPNVRALSAGCPCCTGRVVLQVTLARLLRETGATRVFVHLPDASHAASLGRVLSEPPLGQSVMAGRIITLPDDARLAAGTLETANES